MIITVGEQGLVARRATWRERISARLHASRLDHDLALGVSPEALPELSLRAQDLARARTRRLLAGSVARLLRESRARRTRLAPPPLADLSAVRALHDDLESIVDRLEAPAPVSARGVAMVRELLVDGAGPLYGRRSLEALRRRVQAAAAALDPLRDWPTSA